MTALPPTSRPLGVLLAALAGAAVLFAAWPGLDIAVAGLFYAGDGRFVGQGDWGDRARRVFSVAPFAILGAMTLLYLLRRVAGLRLWAPNGAALLMLAGSLALGPGLLVNVVLKDHSHRPRPYYLTAFGGPASFRPFYRFDGSCARNCSFASGEGATGAWTLAPALLVPPPFEAAAVTAALVLGAATSVLRMAFGGHFLSDTIFAALLTWLVTLLCWRLAARLAGEPPGSLPAAGLPAARRAEAKLR